MKALSIVDAERIERAIHQEIQRSEEARYHHRLHGVLMVLKGYDCYEVAALFAQHPTTIQRWVNEFNKNGFAGLTGRSHTGRPRCLSDSQWMKLKEDMRKFPFEFGYDQIYWDVKLMSRYLQVKYKVNLSIRQCQRIFNRIGFRKHK